MAAPMRVMPNYNVMGMAKASARIRSVRYLASILSGGNIRVNAIFRRPGDARWQVRHHRCAAMFAYQKSQCAVCGGR